MSQSPGIERAPLPDGRLRLSAGRCSFTYERIRPGVMAVVIEGSDKGQFGTAALDEIRLELLRHRPLETVRRCRSGLSIKSYSDRELFASRLAAARG